MAQLAAVPSVDGRPMVKKSKRWSQDDIRGLGCGKYLEQVASKGKGRYGNVNKIEHDGIRFDSKREFLRYMDLKLLEAAGEISDLRVHPRYPITIGGIPIMVSSNQHNKWDRHLTYEADFTYFEWTEKSIDRPHGTTTARKAERVIEDVKMQSGHRTDVYKLKRALMKAMGHDIREY